MRSWRTHPAVRALMILALLYVFLLGVNGLGDGFNSLGKGALEAFFQATENPFIALMVGVLATTLVQSSSVTTSLIVGLVAASYLLFLQFGLTFVGEHLNVPGIWIALARFGDERMASSRLVMPLPWTPRATPTLPGQPAPPRPPFRRRWDLT